MSDRVKIEVTGKKYDKCAEDSCTIVNVRHYEQLKNASLHWTTSGYVSIYLKENEGIKKVSLHRYIINVLEGVEILKTHVVHHKNAVRYDNDINNLEVVTYSQNQAAIERVKSKKTTNFKGIRFNDSKQKWVSNIQHQRQVYYLGAFDNEMDAAIVYDMAFYAIYNSKSGSNNLLEDKKLQEINDNREKYIPYRKRDKRTLPKYVTQSSATKFRVCIRPDKVNMVFGTLEEANNYIIKYNQEKEHIKKAALLSQQIVRNVDGVPIIQLNINDEPCYALVDEDNYYKLLEYKWSLGDNGYAVTKDRHTTMHRMIMKCQDHDGNVIDHINNNKLDNRKLNLRFTTPSFNGRNKNKRSDCTSKYIGVTWKKDKEKWCAYINIQGKQKFLGYYEDEEEAAEAYKKELLKQEHKNTAETAEELEKNLKDI
jgi:hypothetical protein